MIYGFDFGTSNSAISVFDGSRVTLVPLEPDTETPGIMPSYWYYDEFEREWHTGRSALREYEQNYGEGRFIQSLKKVVADENFIGTSVGNRFIKVESLIEIFFRAVKKKADSYTGENIKSIQIGRPVNFSAIDSNGIAVERLEKGAKSAGFETIHFMYEPLAATYTLKEKITAPATIFTLDMGGGTTDISIVRLHPPDDDNDKVLFSSGVSVGGNDFNSAIMMSRLLDYFGNGTKYKTAFGKEMPFPRILLSDISQWYTVLRANQNRRLVEFIDTAKKSSSDPDKIEALEQLIFDQEGLELFRSIEAAKIELSTQEASSISYHRGKISIDEHILKNQFETYILNDHDQIAVLIDEALASANLSADGIDGVLLVGGSVRVPLFKALVKKKFPEAVIYNPDFLTTVAYGLSAAKYN